MSRVVDGVYLAAGPNAIRLTRFRLTPALPQNAVKIRPYITQRSGIPSRPFRDLVFPVKLDNISAKGTHQTERRLAAILAADIVDYTHLMGEDKVRTLSALAATTSGDG